MRRRALLQNQQIGTYLRVYPQEMKWITMATDVDYSVHSNTNWNVT